MFEVRVLISGLSGWRFWRFYESTEAESHIKELLTNGLWLRQAKRTRIYPASQIKRIDVVRVAPTPKERRQIETTRAARMQQLQAN